MIDVQMASQYNIIVTVVYTASVYSYTTYTNGRNMHTTAIKSEKHAFAKYDLDL